MHTSGQWNGKDRLSFPVPTETDMDIYKLRLKLTLEETFEVLEATLTTAVYEESFQPLIAAMTAKIEQLQPQHFDVKPVDIYDSLVDQLYVNDGWANLMGFDMQKGFEEVHNSNLSKFDSNGKAIFRWDGKLLKGPNYKKPDLSSVYDKHKFVYVP